MRTTKPARSARAGFTLIELVIAITLVGMVCAGVFACIRLALESMDRVNSRLMHERRVAGVERIMRAQLEGIVPVALECSAGGDQPPGRAIFFEGRSETMRLVSTYTLSEANRGLPRILELQVIPGENVDSGVRLIVNEIPYTWGRLPGLCLGVAPDPQTGASVPQFAPVSIGPSSFVLADKLAFCHFEYHRRVNPDHPAPEWVPTWSGELLPDAVRIALAPVHPQGSQLQLQPVTVPLHVTREPLGVYAQ